MGKVCSCNTAWIFHPRAQGPEASSITVTKRSKEKKNKFLNCLLLTSQLPMGQTVISVPPCSAFCSLKVSILFWIITFSWKEVLQLWLKKKKNPVNGNTQLNTLVFTLQWSFPDVQSNALIYQPQRFWKNLSYYYAAEGQWLQLYFWHLQHNKKKKSCMIL